MSYLGAKFPEGIDPEKYREISGPDQITCPVFRRTVSRTLNSNRSVVNACQGCGEEDAIILELSGTPGETERLFVRRDSRCASNEPPPQLRVTLPSLDDD